MVCLNKTKINWAGSERLTQKYKVGRNTGIVNSVTQVAGQKNSVDEILSCSAWPEVDTAPRSTEAHYQVLDGCFCRNNSDGRRNEREEKQHEDVSCMQFAESQK